ncbi:MAG: ABC transporter substrate-binding protein [Methanocorpusculum sp.]|nr:ABC transporter substrate-binding protein [Methanocorpusculum sp.]
MRKIAAVLLAAAIVISFCGIASAADTTKTFTDDLGREVVLPAEVNHVSPSGALAQIVLYSFDPSNFISLYTKFSDAQKKYIDPSLYDLKVTGSMFGSKTTMNAEEIIALDKEIGIDVIIDVGAAKASIQPGMDDMQTKTGIPFVFVTQDVLSDIPTSYVTLGKLLGEEKRGQELSDYTSGILKTFETGMAKVGDKKVSMIYVTKVDGSAVNLIGLDSYHGEVIDYLANNAAPKAVTGSGVGDQYTMEDILKMNPEYIIVSGSGYLQHDYYNTIMSDPMWATLDAVKNGKVYEAPVECPWAWMGNPPASHRLVSMLWLGNIFYPDVFNYNIDDKVKEFYSTFYGYKLTDAELSELMVYSKGTAKQTAKTPAPIFAVAAALGAAAVFALRRK